MCPFTYKYLNLLKRDASEGGLHGFSHNIERIPAFRLLDLGDIRNPLQYSSSINDDYVVRKSVWFQNKKFGLVVMFKNKILMFHLYKILIWYRDSCKFPVFRSNFSHSLEMPFCEEVMSFLMTHGFMWLFIIRDPVAITYSERCSLGRFWLGLDV